MIKECKQHGKSKEDVTSSLIHRSVHLECMQEEAAKPTAEIAEAMALTQLIKESW